MKKALLFLFLLCLGSMSAFGQAYPDRHSTTWKDAWISCEETQSPNPKRDPATWIMYDFGDQYSLHKSVIWNLNVPDSTSRGIQDIYIDYSMDGDNWIEMGEFLIPEAPGSAFYEGHDGPDFDGLVARYVLINVVSNHGDMDCSGFSEFRIDATVATSTEVPDYELNLDLAASPNPTRDFTTISISESDYKDLSYQLVDMTGKKVMQGRVNGSQSNLNLSGLPTGNYIYSIYNSEGKKSIQLSIIK